MTIVTRKRSQVQRGYLSAPVSLRFTGSWRAATVYQRGDVIIDPYGVLRWCGIPHTAPSTFNAGTEYSSNTVWWTQLSTNGVFRGPFTSSNGTYNTQYSIHDLVIDPNTGQLMRALYEDASNGGTWSSSNFTDLGITPVATHIDPGIILPPQGMPGSHAAVQGIGLWPRRTRLQYPRVKPSLLFRTSADFTSIGTGTVVADADPIDPNGNPALSFAGSSGAIYLKTLGSSINLQNSIVRMPVKLMGFGQTAQTVGTLGAPGLSTGSAITSIPLDVTGINSGSGGPIVGLLWGLAPGQQITISTQTFTVSDWVSAAAGGSVTQIPIVSQTPSGNVATGTTITNQTRVGVTSAEFQVSSDGFSTTASKLTIYNQALSINHIADSAWDWSGGGPGNWAAVTGFGTPANLAAVTAVRFVLKGAGSQTLSVARVDVIPNNGQSGSKGDGRAKCVLWADDSFEGHWTYLLASTIQYGFPFCEASAGAIDNSITSFSFQQIRHMSGFHGCQMAHHYYFANDGGDNQIKDGPGKDAEIMRSRASMAGASAWGQEIHAWHDDDHPSAQNLPIIDKYFRAARGYNSQDNNIQTLPPVNSNYINAWGVASADTTGTTIATTGADLPSGTPITNVPITVGGSNGLIETLVAGETITLAGQIFTVRTTTTLGSGVSAIPVNSQAPTILIPSGTVALNPGMAMKQFVDATITSVGLCQFAWENVPNLTGHPEINNILLYLDYNRASIDTVTINEVLQPWTVQT